jgi:hypothetical protein
LLWRESCLGLDMPMLVVGDPKLPELGHGPYKSIEISYWRDPLLNLGFVRSVSEERLCVLSFDG